MGKHSRRVTRRFLFAAAAAGLAAAVGNSLLGWGVGKGADTLSGAVVAEDALHVEVSGGPDAAGAFSVMVPQSPEQLSAPQLQNAGTAVFEWAEERGGGAADGLSFQIIAYGQKDHPIILTGMRAKVVSFDPAPSWTLFPPVGAGGLPLRPVGFDLDGGSLGGKPGVDDEHGQWDFPLQVSRADAERFDLTVRATTCDCRFEVLIDYTDGGEKGTRTIRAVDGSPFRVIGSSAAANEMRWEISGDTVTFAQ